MSLMLTLALVSATPDYDPPLRKSGNFELRLAGCDAALDAEKSPPKSSDQRLMVAINDGRCLAFIEGAIGMHEMLVITAKLPRQFCLPLSEPLHEVKKAVLVHAQLAKMRGIDEASFAVLEALHMEYPCKVSK